MSRPSMMPPGPSTSTRLSIFPSSTPSVSASSSVRLAAKQAELEGLRQLRDYSALLVEELERMGTGLNEIRNGGESVAQVMSSWQTVFRSIQVAQASVGQKTQAISAEGVDVANDEQGEHLAALVPNTLVRIPIEQGCPLHQHQQHQQHQQQLPEGEEG